MIEIQLTDNSESLVLPILAPPLGISTIEGATDVQTLDNNISTYFTDNKRRWDHTWSYLSEEDFNKIKAFYDRQWTDYKYPLLTIDHYEVSDVPVRMYLEPRNVVDNCGNVENVTVSFRETRQLESWSS